MIMCGLDHPCFLEVDSANDKRKKTSQLNVS